MKTWYNGKHVNIQIGQKVTVIRISSGRTVFGEVASLTKATSQHLVFTTESGAIVKTQLDNLHAVVGRAKDSNYSISLKAPEEFADFIGEEVRFWDRKTCSFVKK